MHSIHNWEKQSLLVKYHNFKICYHSFGDSKEAILILHGLWQSSWHWQEIIEALSAKYTVLSFDFIGSGLSAKPAIYDYNIDVQSDIAEDLLRLLSIEKVHIIGHDMGAIVAQDMVKRADMRRKMGRNIGTPIASVSFLNGAVGLNDFTWSGGFKLFAAKLLKNKWINSLFGKTDFIDAIVKYWGNNPLPSQNLLNATAELIDAKDGFRAFYQMMSPVLERDYHQPGRNKALKATNVPHQLVAGDTNVRYPNAAAQYQSYFHKGKLVALEGVGYHPHLEQPKAVIQHILDFIKDK